MSSGKQAWTGNSLSLVSHVRLPEYGLVQSFRCLTDWIMNSLGWGLSTVSFILFVYHWRAWDTQYQLPIYSLDLSFPKYETGLVIVIYIIQGASKHEMLTKFEMTLKLPSVLQPKGFVALMSVVLIINCSAYCLMLCKCVCGYFLLPLLVGCKPREARAVSSFQIILNFNI